MAGRLIKLEIRIDEKPEFSTYKEFFIEYVHELLR